MKAKYNKAHEKTKHLSHELCGRLVGIELALMSAKIKRYQRKLQNNKFYEIKVHYIADFEVNLMLIMAENISIVKFTNGQESIKQNTKNRLTVFLVA